MFFVGVHKNELRYASAHTHIVESLRFAHQVGHPQTSATCSRHPPVR